MKLQLPLLLPLFISLSFINLSINVYAKSHNLGHQQFLLLNTKHNLIFNISKSQKLVHWNESGDCCQWNGVACNKGRVIGLDLSEEFISGGLDNSSLFNLQYLQSLNLAHNDIHSSMIPSKFGLLKNLRYLNLSNAGFQGQIPIEIAHLTKLSTLDLSTSFTSQHTLKLEKPNIGTLLQNLTKLAELYLDGVKVSAIGNEWCQAISSLHKLEVLSMSSCNLSGPIDSSLSKLQSLSLVQLSLNNMSSPVPKSLANLSSLTTLQLSSCGLTDVFPKGIFQIQKLNVLDVSNNQNLCGSLPNFSQDGYLQALNVSNTNFSGQLPGTISNLKQLSTLDLSTCQFNGTLPTSLSRLTRLVHLDLSFNNFSGPLPSLNKTKNLKYLSLFQNDLSGQITSINWKGLSNLIRINLGDNSLSGKVPPTLFTLPFLQELILSHNDFDGVLDEFQNASFSTLQFVDLSNNKFQGPIPMSFLHLRSLGYLHLSSNKFNGTIRLDMFQKLQNLHILGLSDNNLTVDATFNDDHGLSSFPMLKNLYLGNCKLRKIPSFLSNQSQLVALDLSNNQIEGMIPNWIWRFDNMLDMNLSNNFFIGMEGPFENLICNAWMVDLHSNQLRGSIPNFVRGAVHLDFSNNKFSFIPPDIRESLRFTYFLSLSNNSFHGKIPQSFCNCSILRMLDLSHNSFNGSMPECLTSRSSTIRVLDIGGNKLTGSISNTIPSSCNLRFLNLNGNFLGGTIPKSLVNCQNLEVLNLGNNMLSDRFPCFLWSISTLRVLILRLNKLHGPIQCQHNIGNWKMLHIVDLAYNNFTGAIPQTLLQSWIAMVGNEGEAQQKSGNLFFDLYDFHHSVRYQDALASLDKIIVMRLAQVVATIPPLAIDSMFSYFVNAYQLQFGGAYLDSATVVTKGLQMKFVKIPAIFASLDFSSNHFEGPIPKELMSFRALIVLNLSHNSFSSHIPSSLGNLTQLESLDLSSNSLSGEIPQEIASLSFLSVLDLSFNYLVGKIPTGTQIQSFEPVSFEGNEGLCGPPITKNCIDNDGSPTPPSLAYYGTHGSIDWNFLSAELGFIFGLGLVILPLIFWNRWRLWYIENVEDLLCWIFPQLYFVYQHRGERKYRSLRWRQG
ncbi:receptor-like protein 7 [Glycine soja]|uniref:Receptor-like protein 12 n=1 Tax=Glycine soja TaxID=3848 RepID=A0A0B2PVT9_GLYSO|nr:receptor-like protein 7 [Glycine soja]KHN11853.1 Receptor-like protein 12 [Glycine soja]RZC19782.1 Receptor-like protein 7 [Glycine soja]